MDVYEMMTGAEIEAFAAYGETVMAVNNDNQGRAYNPADDKIAKIERILGDTQTGPRRKPNPIYFINCSDLCWVGK